MRRLVTGVDGTGRSCVVEEADLAFPEAMPGIGLETMCATTESPPPPRPEGHAGFLDLGIAPGLVRWMVLEYGPGMTFDLHHTDTLDFDIVLAGSVELTLDDGVHELRPGDCVVMTGVDHGWRAGRDGCRLSVVAIGTPPPSS